MLQIRGSTTREDLLLAYSKENILEWEKVLLENPCMLLVIFGWEIGRRNLVVGNFWKIPNQGPHKFAPQEPHMSV